MSSRHNKDTKSDMIDLMTLNDNSHKDSMFMRHYVMVMTALCHGYDSVMSWL